MSKSIPRSRKRHNWLTCVSALLHWIKQYPPVEVWLDSNTVQYVHYGDSDLVKALQLAPILLGIGVGAFILIAYFTFSYIRRTEVSSIWVGMAKETAHQLGTPISSLMGWLELLKTSSDHPERQAQIIFEMQTDINRLNRVATRFSKNRLQSHSLA
ncbi:MAG: histidine kinase dimerization/phospho-acceptor domain-containing protein [Chloroherpetonaceae bacterium]|nr:histidine kinase dimerization/phospho-acceptor domain-containing protein [Chloroherpetonaceae bacterium]